MINRAIQLFCIDSRFEITKQAYRKLIRVLFLNLLRQLRVCCNTLIHIHPSRPSMIAINLTALANIDDL
jgi:hypothetical protein